MRWSEMVRSPLGFSLLYCCLTAAKIAHYLTPNEGRPCELSQLRQVSKLPNDAGIDRRHYLYCSPVQGTKNVWRKGQCKNNTVFVAREQRCRPVSRRQESLCRSQPNAFACPQKQCSAAAAGERASAGSLCDWVSSPLQTYPHSQNYFLQCNPTTLGAPCGVWNQMQCSNGTSFNIYVQICITVALSQASCLPNEIGLFPCGAGNWCPAGSTCRQGVCCQLFGQPETTVYPPYTFNPLTGYPPVTAYPQPPVSTYQPPNPYPQPQPITLYPPINPYPQPQTTPSPYPPQPINPYPQTINPYTYPYPKPETPYPQPINPYPQTINPYPQPVTAYPPIVTGYPPFTQPPPVTLYPPGPPGYTPLVTTPKDLPLCANGQFADTFCADNHQCPNGYCHNGGCCPLPNCPTGILASHSCKDLTDCLPNQFCFNNGCCAIPGCPNGETPTRSCDSNTPCPSPFTCQSGACCASSLPDCPGPESASMPCSGPGTCPENQFCHSDPSGRQGCCAIPKCPNGMPAVQPCDRSLTCPSGLQCVNNACCDLTTGLTLYPPSPGPYQLTYFPTPVPPTLSTPQPSTCQNCCPSFQVAICFCASFNMCPQRTVCGSQGACCASRDVAPQYIGKRPGEKCTSSNECPGFHEGFSTCREGNCVCVNGSYSNGFSCVKHADLRRRVKATGRGRRPRDVQTGAETNKILPGGRDGEQPLYWRTFNESHCVTDNECIPEMICYQGTCKDAFIQLNAECTYDEQCSVNVPFSECRLLDQNNETESSRKICQCEPDYYQFRGECWKECPPGTKRGGKICIINEDRKIKRKWWLPLPASLTDSFNASRNEDLPVFI